MIFILKILKNFKKSSYNKNNTLSPMANPNIDSKNMFKKSEVFKFKNNELIEKKGLKKVRMGECEICGEYSEINYQGRCKRCKYIMWRFSQNKGVIIRTLKRLNIPDEKIKTVLKEEWTLLFNNYKGTRTKKEDNNIPSSPSEGSEEDN
jgi:hypothetical protein